MTSLSVSSSDLADQVRCLPGLVPSKERLAKHLAALAHAGGGVLEAGTSPARVDQVRAILRPDPVVNVDDRGSLLRPQVLITVRGRPRSHGPVVVMPVRGERQVYVHGKLLGAVRALPECEIVAWRRFAGDHPDELAPTTLPPNVICAANVERVKKRLALGGITPNVLRRLGALCTSRRGRVITIAGLVALTQHPGSVLTAAQIVVERYACGVEEQVSARYAPASNRVVNLWVGAALDELPTYLPALAGTRIGPFLKEAILNAVAHRSYAPAHLHEPVRVQLFTDGIRVVSPGSALARVRVDGERGPVATYCRNPRLMSLLAALGLSEGQGRGCVLGQGRWTLTDISDGDVSRPVGGGARRSRAALRRCASEFLAPDRERGCSP